MWRPGGWELIAVSVAFVLLAIPIWLLWKILGRAGLPQGYAFLILLPYFGPFIALAVLAFSRWPAFDRVAPASATTAPVMPAAPAPPASTAVSAVPAGWLTIPLASTSFATGTAQRGQTASTTANGRTDGMGEGTRWAG